MALLDFISDGKAEPRAELLAGLSPVIIMGRGHSGTRILAWLCNHLGILLDTREDAAPGDVHDFRFQDEIKAIALRSLEVTQVEQVDPALVRRFQRAVYGFYTGLGSPTAEWGWKFPETYLIGPCVAAVFPKARYLHLIRDGRDVAFKYHPTDEPKNKLGKAILKMNNAMGLPHHLQAAISWEFQVNHFEAFSARLPKQQIFALTFNELCQQPLETASRLCKFLNLPMTEACRRYLNEDIDQAKISQYRQSDPQQVREIEERVGPILLKYGFTP
jgi:hypothetical protein